MGLEKPKNRLPFFLLSAAVVLLFCFLSNSYAANVITISGKVTNLDLTSHNITIEHLNENNATQAITLKLSDTLEVFNAQGIEAINVGDDVTIDYLIDESGNPVAVYLYKFIPQNN